MLEKTCFHCSARKIEKPKEPKPKKQKIKEEKFSEVLLKKIIWEAEIYIGDIAFELCDQNYEKLESMSKKEMNFCKMEAITYSKTYLNHLRLYRDYSLAKKILKFWNINF